MIRGLPALASRRWPPGAGLPALASRRWPCGTSLTAVASRRWRVWNTTAACCASTCWQAHAAAAQVLCGSGPLKV
eukprot:363316-Chlamydomonas_euryale.AAC.2